MTIQMFLQWLSSLLVRAVECLYFENGSSSEGSESQLLRQTGFPRCGKSTFCCRQVIHVMEKSFSLLADFPRGWKGVFCFWLTIQPQGRSVLCRFTAYSATKSMVK